MKILIIEDERELSDNIVTFLSSENYLCEQAFTFADARMKMHLYEYECIVLDIYNPQNEMFWHFRTKCSFSKTKRTYLTLFSINHIQ